MSSITGFYDLNGSFKKYEFTALDNIPEFLEIAPLNTSSMIASSNIATGKYFIICNNLYLSTASISSGDLVVPGTNCTKVSLVEALNAINS